MTHWTEEAFVENPEVFGHVLEDRAGSAPEETEQLLALLATEHDLEPTSVLDVPCGIGRHAVPLAERGLDVTGVDVSVPYLDRARERADDAGVDPAFVEGDMRDLPVEGTFDLVANLWTSIGYFDAETDRAVLAGFRDRIADGGALVLELTNKDGVLANFDGDGVARDGDHLTVETREYDPGRSRMHTEQDLFRATEDGYEHVGSMTYETRMFAPDTLRRWLLDAGFSGVSLYADLDGGELTRDSSRMVVVAEP
jgi:SAM-dependent methyltransferase